MTDTTTTRDAGLRRPRWRTIAGLAAALALSLGLPSSLRAAVVDPGPLDALLRAHVDDGRVDYAALKKDAAKLDAWLETAAKAKLAGADRAERTAFWINVYNAATLQLILRHLGKIDSIRDIDHAWKKPKWTVAGERLSLDQMEHEKLRRELGDARVHFALVCAARSCPPLRSVAWRAETLDRDLDAATKSFLGSKDGARTSLRDGEPVLALSKLFEWYAADFRSGDRTVADWVARHAPPAVARFVETHRDALTVTWLPYDWSLNAR